MSARDMNMGCEGGRAAFAPAEWLHLAATPVFGLMALLTGLLGAAPADMLCLHSAFSLTGMVPMYVLMSAFHAGPWLKLIFVRA